MTDSTDEPLLAGQTSALPTRVLVFGMVHHDGTLLAREIFPIAEACGQTREQVRSCLRRLVSDGLFERSGEGRDAIFMATTKGRHALETMIDRQRLALAQDAAGRGWDGRWRLIAFAIPETKRSLRDGFRDTLRSLGGAPIQNGLFVSPRDWTDEVAAAASDQDVIENVSFATAENLRIGDETNARAIARLLWDVDGVAARYEKFIAEYQDVPEQLALMRDREERLSDADFHPGTLLIGMRFRDCFDEDPLLPPDLLPRPWPGRKAREILARCRTLGMQVREDNRQPPLFQMFDELLR